MFDEYEGFDCRKQKKLSISDHGFHFVLESMKLKRILLDQLWVQRFEGIELLEDLFKHLNVVNSVNTGTNYKVKFGNPKFNSNAGSLKDLKFSKIRLNLIPKSQCH